MSAFSSDTGHVGRLILNTEIIGNFACERKQTQRDLFKLNGRAGCLLHSGSTDLKLLVLKENNVLEELKHFGFKMSKKTKETSKSCSAVPGFPQ